MNKRIFSIILIVNIMACLAACSKAPTSNSVARSQLAEIPEVDTINWARANSGNIFVTLARQKGYFADVGLTVIDNPVNNQLDAMTALGVGRVDVTSGQGTNFPLSQIAAGQDFTIVGGYMLQGMYLVAKTGTGWNGPKDLIGKKVAAPPSTTTLTGPLLDLGYDPINDIKWLEFPTNTDRLTAVIAGEADYAYLSGDLLFSVGNIKEVEISAFASDPDLMPAYGCCRMNMRTDFVKKNPVTVKLLLKALIRAQAYLEANKEECVGIHAKDIDVSREFVAAYLLNDNYKVSVDPVRNSVIKTWKIMQATGFLPASANAINVEDHINIELYKTALDEVIAEHYDEYPDFFDGRLAFFEQYNK